MFRRLLIVGICSAALLSSVSSKAHAQDRSYGRNWGTPYSSQNWQRFYHYPYVYYPQNYWGQQYFRSGNSLYHRYPPEMRVPVYNKSWHNYYPEGRRYHYGHHFMLDVF